MTHARNHGTVGFARLLGILSGLFLLSCPALVGTLQAGEGSIDFNRDIRPILSNTCFTCHGPDDKKRESEFRIDTAEGAKKVLESGDELIVPGNSAASEFYKRISSSDPDTRMPPADHSVQLTKKQIELIKKWIDGGGNIQSQWSFIKPVRSPLPRVRNKKAAPTPIDRFIVARLEREGVKPSPEADKPTLIRRVTLDLTGLPPTLGEVDAFLADDSPAAYEKVVDRLLKSPGYAEQMTRHWLDVARYGDTHGLHLDNERSIWPYRDWVLKAFNDNKRFDEFTVEQLAGDLLPNATMEQRIATGFNRCNVTTSEGGSIAEEYLVRYAVDRVETTSATWLGLTLGCAVCHEHKFDPVSQKEFYQLFAYFNSLTEKAMDGNALLPPPVIQVPTSEQAAQQKKLGEQMAAVEGSIKSALAKVEYVDKKTRTDFDLAKPAEYVWFEDAIPTGAKEQAGGNGPSKWQIVSGPKYPVFSGNKAASRTGKGFTQIFFDSADAPLRVGKGDRLFAYVFLDSKNPPQEVMLQFHDGSWEHRAVWGDDLIDTGKSATPSRLTVGPLPKTGQWVRLEIEAEKVGLAPGSLINGWAFSQFDGTVTWDKAGIVTKTPQDGSELESLLAWEQIQRSDKKSTLPENIQAIVKTKELGKRSAEQEKTLRDYYVEYVYSKTRPAFDPLHKQRDGVKKKIDALNKTIPSTMVMQDMDKPRDAHLLLRGAYDSPGEKVSHGVPTAIPPALPEDAPLNRLSLARWLVDPDQPLTARVTVNRFWQQYFGTGIVKTAEDFGSQGEWPSHPQLLDWLAVEFVESGWNVKHIQKLIVMSATYRQSSHVTPAMYQKDPQNRLLARGSRFRMDAEMVRDHALAISGLLVNKLGGKSVKPYQPGGLWKAVGYTTSNTANFVKDKGDSLYRRSMYTFWKRTSPPPSMTTFDAPSRESCTSRRARTNTPLQALLLMNDEQFVEAARRLGERMMDEGGKTPESRIAYAFRLATARNPRNDETAIILEIYKDHLAEYQKDADAALKLLSVGDSKRNESLNAAELAAWTMVANLIMNLDETVTKG